MLILTKEDIQKVYSMKDAIEADKQALSLYTNNQTTIPLRTNIDVPQFSGQSLYMPGYISGDNAALGVKIVSVYPNNVDKNLPSVPASMVVLNPETGIVEALLDGTYLTQLRTGAVQGAATDLLARQDAKIAALIGTGGQAFSQLEAMMTVRPLEHVYIFDVNQENAHKFAQMAADYFASNGTTFEVAPSSHDAVKNADIITTVTTAKAPTFDFASTKPGVHINGVGSYTPTMQEIPVEALVEADCVVFDTLDGVFSEAGDIIIPLEQNKITKDKISGELGQVVNQTIKGRQSAADVTVFKSVGSAVLDVYVAQDILTKAKQANIGTNVEL